MSFFPLSPPAGSRFVYRVAFGDKEADALAVARIEAVAYHHEKAMIDILHMWAEKLATVSRCKTTQTTVIDFDGVCVTRQEWEDALQQAYLAGMHAERKS